MGIVEVDEDCNITYSDGSIKPCPYRPSMTFQNCEPGYGSHGLCEKWNYYHRGFWDEYRAVSEFYNAIGL
jgi:hypothetical protein